MVDRDKPHFSTTIFSLYLYCFHLNYGRKLQPNTRMVDKGSLHFLQYFSFKSLILLFELGPHSLNLVWIVIFQNSLIKL